MARKILLADDSVTAQNMGRKILSDAGYEVITVNNGSAALKKISEARPDVIVLDVYMPGYSGLEVCQRLKETADTSRMPVLLTVGKLEPFKPEEAKRVRADAFIVKPFEASELLSALSKLEDRIVPRAEPSKPGRFARAIAAVEESSRAEAASDDSDTGWKNRISFPSKNKKKVEEEEEREAYATTKRVTRAVEPSPAPVAEMSVANAPALPKDVTPEELAALAAAVAQVQAKESAGIVEKAQGVAATAQASFQPESAKPHEIAEAKVESAPVAEMPVAQGPVVTFGDARAEEEYKAEVQREAAQVKAFEKVSSSVEQQPTPETISSQTTEPKAIEAIGAKVQDAAVQDAKKIDEPVSAEVKPAETLAVVPAEVASIVDQPVDQVATPSPADMLAAIAALEPADGKGWDASLASTSSPPAQEHEDEPVTMAAAAVAGAGSSVTSSHWTAVPIALDRDEASISLEREMEKAYAAMVAAESSAPPVANVPMPEAQALEASAAELPVAVPPTFSVEPTSVATVPVESSPVEQVPAPVELAPISQPASEPAVPIIAQHESVLAHALSAVANAVKEAIGVVSHESHVAQPDSSVDTKTEAKVEPPATNAETQTTASDASISESPSAESVSRTNEASAITEVASASAVSSEQTAVPASDLPETKLEISVPALEPQPSVEAAAAGTNSAQDLNPAAEHAPSAAEESEVRSDSEARGNRDMADDRESQAAAAWASWRQIRDNQKPSSTGSAKSKPQDDDEGEYPAPAAEPAAMAVAAGAEKAPEEPADKASNPDAIASIVDSVLADLRPKIVAEISKKLNEKK